VSEGDRGTTLLLASPERLHSPEVAGGVAKFWKIPYSDAARRARRGWGFLGEGLSEAQADGFSAALAEAGIASLRLPDSGLRRLPEASPAAGMSFGPDAVSLRLGDGREEVLPFARAAIVAAAAIEVTDVRKVTETEGPTAAQKAMRAGIMLATGLPLGLGKSKEVVKEQRSTDLLFFMDIVGKDPPVRFRVDARRFDFSCLAREMAMGAVVNFRALLSRLARSAPTAVRNKGCRILLAGQPAASMGYETLDDLDRELRWLANLPAPDRL